jgi:hypothetical protein
MIAAITSTFVASAEREQEAAEAQAEQKEQERVEARFDESPHTPPANPRIYGR